MGENPLNTFNPQFGIDILTELIIIYELFLIQFANFTPLPTIALVAVSGPSPMEPSARLKLAPRVESLRPQNRIFMICLVFIPAESQKGIRFEQILTTGE